MRSWIVFGSERPGGVKEGQGTKKDERKGRGI